MKLGTIYVINTHMENIRRIIKKDFLQLPNGESIHLSQITNIGHIVNLTRVNRPGKCFIGFTINLQNNMIKNIFFDYNSENKEKIKQELLRLCIRMKSFLHNNNV